MCKRINNNLRSMATLKPVAKVLLTVLLSVAPFHTAFAQNVPTLGSPGALYAVLAGPAVTLTDSAITGASCKSVCKKLNKAAKVQKRRASRLTI